MEQNQRSVQLPQSWAQDWTIDRRLGSGAFSSVYHAVRKDHPGFDAAIKIISIPASASESESLKEEGFSESQTQSYYDDIARQYISEIEMMESFKGMQHFVSIEDYKLLRKTDGIGNLIYIRMEMLTPLNNVMRQQVLPESEVLRVGIDICTALEVCEARKVIHRDIKPANIFMNDRTPGHVFYKLGDFGIARSMAAMTHGLSAKGTPSYMAPEVFLGKKYDHRADLYSLGITLYLMMNNNRLPLVPEDNFTASAREEAMGRRMAGEKLPPPARGNDAAKAAILKACEFDPGKRFADAAEMRKALEAALNGAPAAPTTSVLYDEPTADVPIGTMPPRRTQPAPEPAKAPKPGKNKKMILIAAAAAAVVCLGIVLTLVLGGGGDAPKATEPAQTTGDVETRYVVTTPEIVATPEPTEAPTQEPTATPTEEPTATPTEVQTPTPTAEPTATPTEAPTATPTSAPEPTPAFRNYTITVTAVKDAAGAEWKAQLNGEALDAGDRTALIEQMLDIAELKMDPETMDWSGGIREGRTIQLGADGTGSFEAGDLMMIRHMDEYPAGGTDYTALMLGKQFDKTEEGTAEAKKLFRRYVRLISRKHGAPFRVITEKNGRRSIRKKDGQYSPDTDEGIDNLFKEDYVWIAFSAKGSKLASDRWLAIEYDPAENRVLLSIGLATEEAETSPAVNRHVLTIEATDEAGGLWNVSIDGTALNTSGLEALIPNQLAAYADIDFSEYPDARAFSGLIRAGEEICLETGDTPPFDSDDFLYVQYSPEYIVGENVSTDYTMIGLHKRFGDTEDEIAKLQDTVRKYAEALIAKHGNPFRILTVKGGKETSRKRDGSYNPLAEGGMSNLFREDSFRILFSANGSKQSSEKWINLECNPGEHVLWIEIGLWIDE